MDLEVAYLKRIGDNRYEAALEASTVPVTGLGARHLRDLAAFRRLLRLLRERQIEVIHAHLAYATIWGLAAGRLTGVPVVATLHVRPAEAPRWSREGLRRRLLVALVGRWAARVVAVSAALRDAWVMEAGLPPERIEVVHNGTDVHLRPGAGAAESVRRELRVPAGAPVAVVVSVLRPGKGVGVLLDALPAVLSRHPDLHVVIAGDGPARDDLERRAAAAGSPVAAAVRWVGFRDDVPALLAAADLFVLPSLDDALPTALLEAMAAGLPAVASRVGGIPEIVDDGATGLLVPPGDPSALAGALSSLLADADLRARLGTAARAAAEERFSTEAWLARLGRVYGDVLGRPVALGAWRSAP